MMTSKISLTVALAAGLLLISICDVGANPVAQESADIAEPDFGGVEPEPMTEEDLFKLLLDCAVARLRGTQLTSAQVFQIKMALSRVTRFDVNLIIAQNTKEPGVLAQQALGYLLEQCVMEDMGVDISHPPME